MSYRSKADIGRHLAKLRERAGITQRQLAEVMDIDASALSRIEAGRRSIAIDELVRASDFLGVSVESLLRDDQLPFEAYADSEDETIREAVARMRQIIERCETFRVAANT